MNHPQLAPGVVLGHPSAMAAARHAALANVAAQVYAQAVRPLVQDGCTARLESQRAAMADVAAASLMAAEELVRAIENAQGGSGGN